ncbi:MAG: transporter substrate-binding protein [Enterovirga sp.]|jgi:putative spermidine/putrescine transport system substrate-binding protein|nr:transporter substrate-binding protein [Enterovirga sp.]
MRRPITDRRAVLAGLAAAGAAASTRVRAAAPPLPTAPVNITVMDVGGALALMQRAFEDYRAANPKLISRMVFVKAPAPELAAKLQAQQGGGRVDIDLVLTGSDGLAGGLEAGVWQPILPDFADRFPNLQDVYEPAAWNLQQAQGGGAGIVVNYYPSGPLLEYAPERVPTPPSSAEDLLAWAKAHPGRFMYARPSNSGPGRTFMMGLPYCLGDRDPQDPVNGWDKTWAYLAELGQYIDYYPTGTTVTMKEFGEGSRDIVVTTTGWDINPRALGIVPKSAAIATLKGFHWVSDAFFMCVPKGLPADRLAVTLDVMAAMLKPQAQAYAFDEGYLYPGPAVKNVTLAMAPARSREVIEEYGRPEYASLIADTPIELPLKPDKMVVAFRLWDERVGAKVKR